MIDIPLHNVFLFSKSVQLLNYSCSYGEMADPIVSDESLIIFLWNAALLCQFICAFGIATNIVNILCFVKQGFVDPVNVSLLGKTILYFYD